MSNQDNQFGKAGHLSLLAVIIVISLIFKIAHETTFSYWLDEGYTAWFTELSFRDIWLWLPEIESHPPLYYSLVKLWGLIGADNGGLWHRSLSILISLLLVLTSYSTTRRVACSLGQNAESAALFNCFLICFTPVLVWYSLEARPYILMFLAYSLALLGMISIFTASEGRTLKGWALFTIGVILTNWSHHLGGLSTAILYASLALHWMIDRRFEKRFLLWLLGSTLIVLIVSIPLILQIIRQISLWEASSWVPEPDLANVAHALRRVFGFGFSDRYIDPAFGNPPLLHMLRLGLGVLTGLISALLALYGLYRLLRERRYSLVCFFLLSCFALPVVAIAVSIIGPNIFIERILLPGLIPYFMLLALAIGYFDSRTLRAVLKIYYVIVLLLGLYATFTAAEKEPWNRIMTSLADEIGENDVLLLLPNDLYLPARLYVTDPAFAGRIRSVPVAYPAVDYSDFYPDGFPAVPGVRPVDADAIRALFTGKDNVFLITRLEHLFDPHEVTRTLLRSEYDEVEGESWGDIYLDRFRRRPAADGG